MRMATGTSGVSKESCHDDGTYRYERHNVQYRGRSGPRGRRPDGTRAKELSLTCLDRDYARWNYYRGIDGQHIKGRGLKYEFMIYSPKMRNYESIGFEAVRAYSLERGFVGHTGAFTQWLRQNPGLIGLHASIPEDRDCWRDSENAQYVPKSGFGSVYRSLGLHRLGVDWVSDCWFSWSFVAFREIP